MIKATELRLGNLIEYHVFDLVDGTDTWFENYVDIDDMRWISANPNDGLYRPKALTEELLVRMGFTPDSHKICFDHPLPKEPENEHKDLGKTFPTIFFNKRLERWMDCHTRVCVDNAHELQNLYHALTGEELTIKEVNP
jgi:hypothetical protein